MCAYNISTVLDFTFTFCFELYFYFWHFASYIRCFFSKSYTVNSSLLNSYGNMGTLIFYSLFIITNGEWKSDLGL